MEALDNIFQVFGCSGVNSDAGRGRAVGGGGWRWVAVGKCNLQKLCLHLWNSLVALAVLVVMVVLVVVEMVVLVEMAQLWHFLYFDEI